MRVTERADLIVVGAGSAGCIVAARASEDGTRSVLLLEAGPDYPPEGLPSDLASGIRNSLFAHDWGYRHRPRPGGPRLLMPRGRVVGGSSAVNTCIALRGQAEDYDEWADRGLSDWSFERCLPAFRRLERDLDFDNSWHGRDGPLPIRRARSDELAPWQAAFLEACDQRGLPAADDLNDPTQTGYGPHPMNLIEGRRISAAEAFLTDAVRQRDNFRLAPERTVRRVLFEGQRAIGVEVEHRGAVQRIEARKVVLSAGVFNTPELLLRSGVGPRADVERLGAEPVAENENVGRQLLDHPGHVLFLIPKPSTFVRGAPLIQTGLRFTSYGSAVPNDLQVQPGSVFAFPWTDLPLVALMMHVGKPKSVGRVHFSADGPVIDSRLFEAEADVTMCMEAVDMARALVDTPALRKRARLLVPRRRSRRWVRRLCDSGYHPCGTVPMGAEGDPEAACDGRGRVRGVENLIVADASLMPTIPTSNINLPTLMIGERFGAWLSQPSAW